MRAGPPSFPSPFPRGRAGRGFSLFELAVAIIVASVLATVLLNRLAYYQELAEKAAMESTLRTIKTGLQIRLAELIVTHRQALAGQIEAEDPVRWLDDKPPNYRGAYRAPAEPGAWYFDTTEHQLVYVVRTGDRLILGTRDGGKQLRFRAKLLKSPVKVAGGTVEGVAGVTLLPDSPYQWQ
jgi:prepilin-type N-terminal cleavage/methylation domain-containing protein